MDDLGEFVKARLDEDEAAAKAATPGPWEFEGDDPTDDELFTVHEDDPAAGVAFGDAVAYTRGEGRPGSEGRQVANGRFMERHDPPRALREVTAKRAILTEIAAMPHHAEANAYYSCSQAVAYGEDREIGSGCLDDDRAGKPCDCGRDARAERMLSLLASVWNDHPDYRWSPPQ